MITKLVSRDCIMSWTLEHQQYRGVYRVMALHSICGHGRRRFDIKGLLALTVRLQSLRETKPWLADMILA